MPFEFSVSTPSDNEFSSQLMNVISTSDEFIAIVGFAWVSGVEWIIKQLKSANIKNATFVLGKSFYLTEPTAMEMVIDNGFTLKVYTGKRTFHPKIYIGKNSSSVKGDNFIAGFVGSSNLSSNAIWSNIEANMAIVETDKRKNTYKVLDGILNKFSSGKEYKIWRRKDIDAYKEEYKIYGGKFDFSGGYSVPQSKNIIDGFKEGEFAMPVEISNINKQKNISAKGIAYKTGEIKILKNSVICDEINLAKSLPQTFIARRNSLIKKKVIAVLKNKTVIKKDWVANSVSMASYIVVGTTGTGFSYWKRENTNKSLPKKLSKKRQKNA